jgi:hypothetical protein
MTEMSQPVKTQSFILVMILFDLGRNATLVQELLGFP